METGIWTIFHKSGIYTADYAPVWQRYVCCGALAESVKQADGDGKGKNRLTLRIRDHFARLFDQDGHTVSAKEAGISPGDLISPGDMTVGEAAVPDGVPCWRITAVGTETGSAFACGTVITAE